ncbi:MAG: hypothetical protein L6R41_006816 [Letrouitia leprolyta]|nr:MAG: hypothetical protein L6R41_006816 [Letrouitia leprolyta]
MHWLQPASQPKTQVFPTQEAESNGNLSQGRNLTYRTASTTHQSPAEGGHRIIEALFFVSKQAKEFIYSVLSKDARNDDKMRQPPASPEAPTKYPEKTLQEHPEDPPLSHILHPPHHPSAKNPPPHHYHYISPNPLSEILLLPYNPPPNPPHSLPSPPPEETKTNPPPKPHPPHLLPQKLPHNIKTPLRPPAPSFKARIPLPNFPTAIFLVGETNPRGDDATSPYPRGEGIMRYRG